MMIICASKKLDMDEKIRRWDAELDGLLKACDLEPSPPSWGAIARGIRALRYSIKGAHAVYDELGISWPLEY